VVGVKLCVALPLPLPEGEEPELEPNEDAGNTIVDDAPEENVTGGVDTEFEAELEDAADWIGGWDEDAGGAADDAPPPVEGSVSAFVLCGH